MLKGAQKFKHYVHSWKGIVGVVSRSSGQTLYRGGFLLR